MADFTWLDALKFGSASGLIAGIANQAFGYVRDAAGFRRTTQAQKDERAHQALLSQEAAHANSRAALLPFIEDVREWISFKWGDDFGLEVDYHGSHVPQPSLKGPAEVIRSVDRVATGHPTAAIRRDARSLRDRIDGCYNMIEDGHPAQPGIEDFSAWLQSAEALIEAMHLPSSA